MILCKDMKLSLKELRQEFQRLHPSIDKNSHMNLIAQVMLKTDLSNVSGGKGPQSDFYRRKHIINTCKAIIKESK